jgi:catechol 2,3-dioxygenase-like lactoylglutathione lyase family enzyme
MIRTEVIIAVNDVERSSKWYQRLLGCKSSHGGGTFEILADEDGTVLLCLHKWGEHDHPTMSDPKIPIGNGVILYIKVADLEQIWGNAISLNSTIEQGPHFNHNSGKEQFILRDLDQYYLIISADH